MMAPVPLICGTLRDVPDARPKKKNPANAGFYDVPEF
jgi:hypothetical protein